LHNNARQSGQRGHHSWQRASTTQASDGSDVVEASTTHTMVEEGVRHVAPTARSRHRDSGIPARAGWDVPAWSARLREAGRSSGNCVHTVLVIDDRSDRQTSWCNVADVLRFVGYTVCDAAPGDDALRLQAYIRFDAVVVDSGPPETGVVRVARDGDTVTNLEKPVQPDELVCAVHAALGASS
jgi:hypothetical protein